MNPTQSEIEAAIKVLQSAIMAKFGEDAVADLTPGEGCEVDVSPNGVDLIGEDCSLLIQGGTAADVAHELTHHTP